MSHINRANPARWVTPAFPTNGTYRHDSEVAWIDSLERALERRVPILESFESFNACEDDVARVRAEIQVATQHCNVAYFENLETLLRNIGQMRRLRAVIWCGFGTFGMARPGNQQQDAPYPITLLDRRLDTLAVLYAWLCGQSSCHPVAPSGLKCTYGEREEWICNTLGEPSAPKRWLVGHLSRAIKEGLRRPWLKGQRVTYLRYPLYIPFGADPTQISDDGEVLDEFAERVGIGASERQLWQMMKRPEDQPCHFRFDRWIDNLITAIGRLSVDSPHAPAEAALSVEAWVDRIRVWVRAINAWIDADSLTAASTQNGAVASVLRRVYAILGAPSPTKLWLTASLSKTIRSFGDAIRPGDEPPPHRFLMSQTDSGVSLPST